MVLGRARQVSASTRLTRRWVEIVYPFVAEAIDLAIWLVSEARVIILGRLPNPALRPGEINYVLEQSEAVGAVVTHNFRGEGIEAIVGRVSPTDPTCATIFAKLDLEPDPDINRRVLAVLAHLDPSQ